MDKQVYFCVLQIVDSSLIFDLLNLMGQTFNPKDIELILTVLRSVGFRLRKDDPIRLKELILLLQKKATESQATNQTRLDLIHIYYILQ